MNHDETPAISDISDAVRAAAAPGWIDPALRRSIGAELDRRRRRRAALVTSLGAVVAVVAVVGGAGLLADREPASAPPTSPADNGEPGRDWGAGWQPMAASPLSPRQGAVGTWTGEELIVVGGDAQPPCPPTADCTYEPEFLADGAAYDPDTDTWRRIADVPEPVAGAVAAWNGEEVIVVDGDTTHAYDPAGDSWSTLGELPEGDGDPALVSGSGTLAYVSYDQPGRTERPSSDALLDLEMGEWSPLPSDPFGESYDRSLAWDGERWWLLSMAVENHGGAYRGTPSRVAVLENGDWRVVDEDTPDLTYGQGWYWDGEQLVVPGTEEIPTRAFDIETETWSELAPPGPIRCPAAVLPFAPAGAPACPQLADPTVAVWTGTQVLLWGGPDERYRRNTASGLVWTPEEGR